MRTFFRGASVLGLAAVALALAGIARADKKVAIPFDFVSKWDEGKMGQQLGEMVWKKLERSKAFTIPETMSDVRDTLKANNRTVTPETPIETIQEIVRKDFDAQIGIWGSVERAPGTDGEIYDLVIKCVDFTGSDPRVVYECKNRTNSAAEVPHLYVKAMMDALLDRKPGQGPVTDPIEEENWKKNPNIIVGGDFERAVKGVPVGWEPTGGQPREPLGNQIRWMPEAGGSPGNHVVRFVLSKGVAEGTGVMWYSKPFPVHENSKYRFQVRYRTNGPSPKVFIKCYDELPTTFMRDEARVRFDETGEGRGSATSGRMVGSSTEAREVYRSQQNLKGAKGQWNTQTEDFTPKHTKYNPKFGRVMLYAYLSEGLVEWDDVVIKEIMPASGGDMKKERRHSLETKVTLKEMEENNRATRELKEQKRREKESAAGSKSIDTGDNTPGEKPAEAPKKPKIAE